jgi:hypothetical protein
MVARNKTVPHPRSASEVLASIADPGLAADSRRLLELMRRLTGVEPVVWGTNIIGYGTHHFRYESGREGDTVAVGFAPRARALVLYGVDHGRDAELARSLGTHTVGAGCLYIRRLSDIDLAVLGRLIKTAYSARNNVEPGWRANPA